MTYSQRAKQLGAKSVKQVADEFGCTPENLRLKFKSKPHQFDIIVMGAVAKLKGDLCIKHQK